MKSPIGTPPPRADESEFGHPLAGVQKPSPSVMPAQAGIQKPSLHVMPAQQRCIAFL
jgi:hypothetical protein